MRKNTQTISGICAVLVIALGGCGASQGGVSYQADAPAPAPVAPQSQLSAQPAWPQHTRTGFSFRAPPSWEEISAPAGTHIAVRETQFAGNFAPNMNVASEPYARSIRDYARQSLDALRGAGFTLIRETPLTFQGREVHDIEGTWSAAGVPTYVTVQRYVVLAGRGFVITCAASQVQFEQHRATCQQVLDSFDVTGPPATEGAAPVVQGPNWTLRGPFGWSVIPSPVGTEGAIRSNDASSGFAPNANVTTEPWSGTLANYVQQSQISLQQSGAQILGVTPSSLPGRVTQDVESVWNAPNVPTYRTVQRFVVHNGAGYVVTCAAAHASFEQHRASCNEVLNSFLLQ